MLLKSRKIFTFSGPLNILGEVPFIEMDKDWAKNSSDEEEYSDGDELEGTMRKTDRWKFVANKLRRNRMKRQLIRSKRLRGRVKFVPNHQFKGSHPFAADYEMHCRVCFETFILLTEKNCVKTKLNNFFNFFTFT